MKILICNERFLFRFGVDRVLLLLAKHLIRQGHELAIMANTVDQKVTDSLQCDVIIVPEGTNYYDNNEYTVEWLGKNWDKVDKNYDLALIAGWPFLMAIDFFASRGIKVVYNDYGVVPFDDSPSGQAATLRKLQSLKRRHIKQSGYVVGISDFITESQVVPVLEGRGNYCSLLLGADHMQIKLWKEEDLNLDISKTASSYLMMAGEAKKVLLTGRFEQGCYKNVEASFDILRSLKNTVGDVKLFILAKDDEVLIPYDLEGDVIPVGFLSDEQLQCLMENVDLGISTSLWEGFNLPLAEMQWLGKPMLVFNVGAHPEVVCHPWYLCDTMEAFAKKAIIVLKNGTGLPKQLYETSCDRFRSMFQWDDVCRKYEELFIKIKYNSIMPDYKPSVKNKYDVFIDVTNAAKDPANTGVMRVTRRFSNELQNYIDPVLIVWENDRYYIANNYEKLGAYNGPHDLKLISSTISLDDYLVDNTKVRWLVFTETLNEGHASIQRNYARRHKMNIAAIFYDAIPVLHPEYCNATVAKNHISYMKGLAECDIVMPISDYSKDCLLSFWEKHNISPAGSVITNLLAAEMPNAERRAESKKYGKGANILCVSTLEPRKNHTTLLNAIVSLIEKYPELNLRLQLVGNRYAGNDEIPAFVEDITRRHPQIQWLGVVPDDTLYKLYTECTFTVYPSVIEGFGLPIIESLWHGAPCICYGEGVMGQLAVDGGCLTADVKSKEALANAIYLLSTDKQLYERLSQQAIFRHIKSWNEYAREALDIIEAFSPKLSHEAVPFNIDNLLYKNCILEQWQMNHSERLAIKAILSGLMPRCSLEIGTFRGGSLSLISQYSDIVFSIDIDITVKEKYGHLKNVVFLTGPSQQILPILFDELTEKGIHVDFILVDGDHSYDGVRQDLNAVFSYKADAPVVVLCHDTFNPSCRQGAMDADWAKARHVRYADLDFIPGRMVEHGGGGDGEMWGGLGLIYLDKGVNDSASHIESSSGKTFELLRKHCYDARN